MYEVNRYRIRNCGRYIQNTSINVDLDGYSWRNEDGVNLCRRKLDWIENNMNMVLRNLCMKEECALCQLCMQNYSQLLNILVLELE